jgi:hypothetical protein
MPTAPAGRDKFSGNVARLPKYIHHTGTGGRHEHQYVVSQRLRESLFGAGSLKSWPAALTHAVFDTLFDTLGLGTRARMAPNQVRFELASAVLTAENPIAGD